MIAAVSSEGKVLFTVNKGINTSMTFLFFIKKLCEHLDKVDREWRTRSLLLVDNASIHRSAKTITGLRSMAVPLMFLAPYSFDMAAVEKLFSFVKNRDLNPLAIRAYSK